MRRLAPLLLLVPGLSLSTVGCIDLCTDYPGACDPAGAGGGGGSGGGPVSSSSSSTSGGGGEGGSSGEGGGGGAGGGVDPGCDPRALGEGVAVPITCGVFVDPGGSPVDADGSQGNPYVTLGDALGDAGAAGLPVYVCAQGGEGLDEGAALDADRTIFGGMACDTWEVAAAGRTAWTAPANTPPLVITGAETSVTVVGFAITARAAVGADPTTREGRSSIGVVVSEATVTLESVDVVAGDGAAGADGADGDTANAQAAGRDSSPSAFNGTAGGACGVAMNGAPQIEFTCSDGVTRGGRGGAGDVSLGDAGGGGLPTLGLGAAGAGDMGNAWTCAGNNGNGGQGQAGTDRSAAAAGSEAGQLAASFPYLTGGSGGSGLAGTRGQGGGGGGGVRGDGSNGCAGGQVGPGGGSGGAGGCGGLGGEGGGAGGSSIALLSLDATLSLVAVSLVAGSGEAGGDGGNRQLGGFGGLAGTGGFGCSGGLGGNGGTGATGGGGRGGHSIGIAYVGTAPDLSDDAITVAADPPASGGNGGSANLGNNAGAAGTNAKKQAFPAN